MYVYIYICIYICIYIYVYIYMYMMSPYDSHLSLEDILCHLQLGSPACQ